tara:strand:- start:947 stop:1357 length:411 start_codon:yes stop_codon:yes gene_type:complete
MFQFLKLIPIILSGVIIGIILYQSLLIAPSINKLLSTQDASLYLRFIWPKFFIIIGIISLISWILILNFSTDQNTAKIISLSSFVLMLICYVMIPYMNSAKDSGASTLFIFLHAISMILTLVTLLINIILITKWKY